MEYLQSSKADDEGKLQMVEILQRAKEAEQREEEEFTILRKLEELDLGKLPVLSFLRSYSIFVVVRD